MKNSGLRAWLRKAGRVVLSTPTYARQSEALITIVRHATFRRLLNLVIVEIEYRLRKVNLLGKPYVLVVDPTNVCNLRCPLCPTGLHNRGRKGLMMPWDTFTGIIDEMAPTAFKVNLFNWGESLLNTNIFNMISYAKAKGLGTTMSTNLSIELDDTQIDSLLHSGLEFLFFSVDGATQSVYEQYRRKGNLELVLKNMRRLVDRKAELKLKRPILEWQFIPMRHNEHQVDEARKLSDEIGCDRFRCIPVGIPFDSPNPIELQTEWFPNTVSNGEIGDGEEISENTQSKSACYFLYRYLIVNPDNKVSPCCVVYGERSDFGDINTMGSFKNIWNNENYRSGRAQFNKGGNVEVPTICDGCDLFEKRSTL
jgi:MoaA/NifB/PqqE/SkfB family radical SAM enzyme